jgi:hypothetical protein
MWRAANRARKLRITPKAPEKQSLWLDRFSHLWDQPLAALDTEIARGKRARKARKQ